eukprot:m.340295 g.340295  ORF g.340295 m.340295 type:complete len:219 (-) comp19227_c0_seq1:164-820(-)
MSTTWDPDPETPALKVTILKDSDLIGLQVRDAAGPQEYPVIEKIARGTPAFNCTDINLGDSLKYVNGLFLKGKGKDLVHKTVRDLAIGSTIEFQVIKGFIKKEFQSQGRNFRVASIRRSNPLMAMMEKGDLGNMDAIGEDEEEQGKDPTEIQKPETKSDEPPSRFRRKRSVYNGFGDTGDENAGGDAADAGFDGFGEEINDADFGFEDIDQNAQDPWS